MSLDVYLIRKNVPQECECECPRCGKTVAHMSDDSDAVFSANITHNLGAMAEAAGIYYTLWRPEEIGALVARDIIPLLEKGLADLKARPGHFGQFDAENGWGTYEQFVPWVEKYLAACVENPDAKIKVSR